MTLTQQGAFYTGEYRNIFKELGFSEDDINAKLNETWNDLFYGDPNVRIYYPQDEDKSYILDTGNLDVRSEGMSYGMMMAVQMNKKKSLIVYGTSQRRLCSTKKVAMPITLLGTASLTVQGFLRDLHLTAKSFSPWLCFLPQNVGGTVRNLIIILSRPKRYCMLVYIKLKQEMATQCGTRKRN